MAALWYDDQASWLAWVRPGLDFSQKIPHPGNCPVSSKLGRLVIPPQGSGPLTSSPGDPHAFQVNTLLEPLGETQTPEYFFVKFFLD